MSVYDKTLAAHIAIALGAYNRCMSSAANASQASWAPKWKARIERMELELPRGSGFDDYPAIDWDKSTEEKLIFRGSYHKMNDVGYYDGWRDYRITVTASLVHGLTVKCSVGGDLGDYIHECFDTALRARFDENFFVGKKEGLTAD